MKRNRIYIPNGTLDNEEIETMIGKLAMCGYAVKRGKDKDGVNKNLRYIEYWNEED